MRTLQVYAETAIRRDLARARTVLAGGARLGPERRRAMVDHLTWLMSLVQPGSPEVSPAAAAVRDRATSFRPDGYWPEREEVVRALDAFERIVAPLQDWTSPDVLRVASGNLPWVLDAIDPRGGPGLVLPPTESPEVTRCRVSEYRRKRALLWGTVALRPSLVPRRVLASSPGRG